MPLNLKELVKDPEYQKLSLEEKIKGYSAYDESFAGMSREEQVNLLQGYESSQQNNLPPASENNIDYGTQVRLKGLVQENYGMPMTTTEGVPYEQRNSYLSNLGQSLGQAGTVGADYASNLIQGAGNTVLGALNITPNVINAITDVPVNHPLEQLRQMFNKPFESPEMQKRHMEAEQIRQENPAAAMAGEGVIDLGLGFGLGKLGGLASKAVDPLAMMAQNAGIGAGINTGIEGLRQLGELQDRQQLKTPEQRLMELGMTGALGAGFGALTPSQPKQNFNVDDFVNQNQAKPQVQSTAMIPTGKQPDIFDAASTRLPDDVIYSGGPTESQVNFPQSNIAGLLPDNKTIQLGGETVPIAPPVKISKSARTVKNPDGTYASRGVVKTVRKKKDSSKQNKKEVIGEIKRLARAIVNTPEQSYSKIKAIAEEMNKIDEANITYKQDRKNARIKREEKINTETKRLKRESTRFKNKEELKRQKQEDLISEESKYKKTKEKREKEYYTLQDYNDIYFPKKGEGIVKHETKLEGGLKTETQKRLMRLQEPPELQEPSKEAGLPVMKEAMLKGKIAVPSRARGEAIIKNNPDMSFETHKVVDAENGQLHFIMPRRGTTKAKTTKKTTSSKKKPDEKTKPAGRGQRGSMYMGGGIKKQPRTGTKKYSKGEPVVRETDLVTGLSRDLKVMVRAIKTKAKARVSGQYNPVFKSIMINSKNNFEAAVHEVFHDLDVGQKIFDNMPDIQARIKDISHLAGQGNIRQEAIAEFGRLYVTDPLEAKAQAPQFYKAFEQDMQTYAPELMQIITKYQKAYDIFRKQSSVHYIASKIGVGKKETNFLNDVKVFVKTAKFNFQKYLLDKYTGLKDMPDAYINARILGSESGARTDLFLNGKPVDFISGDILYGKKGLSEILKPVKDDLENFIIYAVGRRGIELHGQGRNPGFSLDEALNTVKELETPVFNKAANDLIRFNRDIMEYIRDAGLIDNAAYNRILANNKEYTFPLERILSDSDLDAFVAGQSRDLAKVKNTIRTLEGSDKQIKDPLGTLVNNVSSMIFEAGKNRLLHSLMTNLEDKGKAIWLDPDVVDISKEKNKVSFVANGKRQNYFVEPEIKATLSHLDGINYGSFEIVADLLALPTKALKFGATVTPEFLTANFIRDTAEASIYSKNGFKPYLDSMKGLFKILKKDPLVNEWMSAGGSQVSFASDLKGKKKLINDMVAEFGGKSVAKNAVIQLEKVLEKLGSFSDSSSRIKEFENSVNKQLKVLGVDDIMQLSREERGKVRRKAAFDSRELTIDFQRSGVWGQHINKFITFFNAAVQGTDRLARAGMDKEGRGFYVKAISYITLPYLAMTYYNMHQPWWDGIEPWEKYTHFIIPVGGTPEEPQDIYKIPMPISTGMMFGTLPASIMESAIKNNIKPLQESGRQAKETFATGVLPQAVIPFMEQWANKKSYFDTAIVPDNMENLLPEDQFNANTTKTAKLFGKAIGVSPLRVEAFLHSTFAGMGVDSLKIMDEIGKIAGVYDRTTDVKPIDIKKQIPVLKRFVISKERSAYITRFYNAFKKARQATGSLALIDYSNRNETERFFKKHPEVNYFDELNSLSMQMSDLTNAKVAAIKDSKLTPVQKMEEILKLTKQLHGLAKQGVLASERSDGISKAMLIRDALMDMNQGVSIEDNKYLQKMVVNDMAQNIVNARSKVLGNFSNQITKRNIGVKLKLEQYIQQRIRNNESISINDLEEYIDRYEFPEWVNENLKDEIKFKYLKSFISFYKRSFIYENN